MGKAGAVIKLLKSLFGGAAKAVTKAASKVAGKISFKAISIVGLGGFTIYSIFDGFNTVRDWARDVIDPFLPWDVTTNQVNFMVIGAVAIGIILIVRWFRRSD